MTDGGDTITLDEPKYNPTVPIEFDFDPIRVTDMTYESGNSSITAVVELSVDALKTHGQIRVINQNNHREQEQGNA